MNTPHLNPTHETRPGSRAHLLRRNGREARIVEKLLRHFVSFVSFVSFCGHFGRGAAALGHPVFPQRLLPTRCTRLSTLVVSAVAFGLSSGLPGPHAQAQEPPTYYVNTANPTPLFPYTSWATAATNIQSAVDAGTTPGRLILVTDGVYQGGVDVTGAVLRSVSGPAVTIIEGGLSWMRSVYLRTNATLSGFTVRNGGGVYAGASGVVTNCVLSGNRAPQDNLVIFWPGEGGGAYGGTLYNCILTDNWAGSGTDFFSGLPGIGGGASGSVLYNCVLSGNAADGFGGAVYNSTLYNCRLTDNRAFGFWGNLHARKWEVGDGGGAAGCSLYNCVLTGNSAAGSGGGASGGTLYNCTLTGNSAAGSGGGASGGTLYNCTLTGNSAAESGGGASGGTLYNCTLTGNSAPSGGGTSGSTLYNSIVYFNQGGNWHAEEGETITLDHCCTTPLPPGPGNITADPQFTWGGHVSSTSPCLAAGDPARTKGMDMDGEPWADPPAIGADQVWTPPRVGPLTLRIAATFTQVAVGFPVRFRADTAGPIRDIVWDFGDGTVVTNQPVATHTWVTPGHFSVRLTGYNETHVEGVETSLPIEVVEAVYYVNVASAKPVFPYTTWATAATNIQDAVNAGTAAGRSVLVADGVYRAGTVDVGGYPSRVALTNVLLRSINGPEVTVIDGVGAVRCAYLRAGAVLSGFTLRNGRGEGSSCGGVLSEDSGVVTNCVLSGNAGGGACTYGRRPCTLYNCTLTGNEFGQGAENSVLYNCTLTGNSGGGALDSVLYDCTLTGNSGGGALDSVLYNCAVTGSSSGGAVNSTLYNCILTGNEEGGANNSTLYNCTVTGNSGRGANGGTLQNCIVYFNQGGNWSGSTFEYSCTTPLPPGAGNIALDPQLASTAHLSATSPCLGAGSPEWASGRDLDGEPWADPPAMGADQVWAGQTVGPLAPQITTECTEVAPGIPISFTAQIAGSIRRSVWDFGDGTVVTNQPYISHAWQVPGRFTVRLTAYNDAHPEGVTTDREIKVIDAVHYVNRESATPVFPYTSWATAATTIQDAVRAATAVGRLGLVLVTNGVYRATRGTGVSYPVVLTRTVLRSVNGPEETIIEGGAEVPCVSVGTNSVLSGFTVRNGSAGGVGAAAPSSLITNCVLTANAWGASGGTLYDCSLTLNQGRGEDGRAGGANQSTLYNCIVTGNTGGGANGSALYNCIVTGNTGAGANDSMLFNCTLVSNYGGGANGGTLYNCSLNLNRGVGSTGSTLYNCLLTGNDEGGAVESTLYNCTLTGNSGLGAEGGRLQNCIVYFNQGGNWDERVLISLDHCCTTPLPPGPGNITANPGFVDAAAGDFRLRPDSPCIDAVTDLTWSLTTDLLGVRRPLDGNGDGVARMDIGAYEFSPYRFGPVLLSGPDGFRFTVLGEPGRTVRVERSRDLRSWETVTTVLALPASGQALLDAAAVGERLLFYRAAREP